MVAKARFEPCGGIPPAPPQGSGQTGRHRVHLVLHDFGGPSALQWAAGDPDRFASVLLINCAVLLDYRSHYLACIWQRSDGRSHTRR